MGNLAPERRFLRHCGLLGAGLCLALGLAPAQADDEPAQPALAVLQHGRGGALVNTAIPPKAGLSPSPNAGKPQEKWRVLPGGAIQSGTQPPERTVALYQGSGVERILLCSIRIRYYRNADGTWSAHFQLIEEPLFIRAGDRWIPFATPGGAPNLIVLTSASLPNAEGFYPWLEFGLSSGPVAIDGWIVE